MAVLKDLQLIRGKFSEIKNMECGFHKKKDVYELQEERKTQLLFLEIILSEIETNEHKLKPEQKELEPEQKLENVQSIYAFYGAMALIHKLTARQGSNLHLLLAEALNIKETDYSSNLELFRYFKKLNTLLKKMVFNNDEYHGGIKQDHRFETSIKYKYLHQFIDNSIQLERAYAQKVLETLPGDGATCVSAKDYRVEKPTSLSALARFPDWDQFKQRIQTIKEQELIKKKLTSVDKLPEQRRKQLYFLERLNNVLIMSEANDEMERATKFTSKEKVAILAGALLVIEKQVTNEHSYKSKLQTLISDEVGKEGTKAHNAEALVYAFSRFCQFMLTEKSKDIKMRKSNPFISGNPKNDINLRELLSLSQVMLCNYRREISSGELLKAVKKQNLTEDSTIEESATLSLSSIVSAAMKPLTLFGFGAKAPTREDEAAAAAFPQ